MPSSSRLSSSKSVGSWRRFGIAIAWCSLAIAAFSVFASENARASLIVNGDFEDTSGSFPNGWTAGGNVHSVNTMFGQSAAELIINGGSISQRFISTSQQDALTDFQLDFAFRTSVAPGVNTHIQHRIQLLSFNSVNVVTLSFDKNHINTFSTDGWKNDLLLPVDILADTTYFVRLIGDFDQTSYTLGFSTDGTNYTTGTSTRFHNIAPFNFAIIKFDANELVGESITVDNVSVTQRNAAVPEPSSILLFSIPVGLAALARRRHLK